MSFRTLMRLLVPAIVLVAGVGCAQMLIATAPKPPQKPRQERAMLVETRTVAPSSYPVVVKAKGTVIPTVSLDLQSEISGRVIWKNPELTLGGRVKKGDVLVRIDARDIHLSIEQQRAAVERANAELALERGRKAVAEQEWQLFAGDKAQGEADLALRGPQLRTAEVGLKGAKSGLDQAKLQLSRTVIRAPFDALVRSNSVEVGRLVSPNQAVATLVASSSFLVVVSLPVDDLAWLKVPGINSPLIGRAEVERARKSDDPMSAFAELGALARITQRVGDKEIERGGLVVRLLSDLDSAGRMARLLVSISDPLGTQAAQEGRPPGLPMLLGAYVHVEIGGSEVQDVIRLPRLALRGGDKVFVADSDDKLEIRPVEIVRRGVDEVFVKSGLGQGDRVIVSAMPAATPGMELRVRDEAGPEARAEGSREPPTEVPQ